jgi:hypothetical protein
MYLTILKSFETTNFKCFVKTHFGHNLKKPFCLVSDTKDK